MTQKEWTLKRLKERGSITGQEAFREYSIWRLPVIIERLRKSGVHIVTKMEPAINRQGQETEYARYVLVGNHE